MEKIVEHVATVASHLGNWGYLIILVMLMLECQALLGFFIPGESLVLLTGFLASQGVFDLQALIIAIAVGAIIGDTIGYELGRHLGLEWLRRNGPKVGIDPAHFDRVDRFIGRHGGKSVFLGHFMHVLRALMPYMAGANRMRYLRFVSFNAAGCVAWASLFTLVGYFVGESWRVVAKWIGRAGVLVGVVVVLVIAFAWFWAWLARHETAVRLEWNRFTARPRVRAFCRRFGREIEFLERRLTPGGYLGLHLTIGAVIFLLAGWWFGGVVQDLIARDPLITVDHRLVGWFHAHATPRVTEIAVALTRGEAHLVLAGSLLAAMVLAFRRAWHRLVTLIVAIGGGALLNLALEHFFHRTRPEVGHPIPALTVYSFPSAHTVVATLFFGWLAVEIVQHVRGWRWRLLAPIAAAFVILLDGLIRMYLRTDYLSDVLAAIALGIMWLSFSVTAVGIDRRYRAAHAAR